MISQSNVPPSPPQRGASSPKRARCSIASTRKKQNESRSKVLWNSAMGESLNDDIIRIVLSHLRPGVPSFDSEKGIQWRRQALYNAAQASKSVCYSALPVLWSDLTDLGVLLDLLHSTFKGPRFPESPPPATDDSEEPEEEDERDHAYHFDGPIIPSEWERLKFYANFVHRLEYKRADITVQVYEQLMKQLDGQPLLPNLREFHWEQHCYIHAELTMFITPCLEVFRLNGGDVMDLESPFDEREDSVKEEHLVLNALTHRPKKLREVSISRTSMCHTTLAILGNFPYLESLYLDEVMTHSCNYKDLILPSSAFSIPGLKRMTIDFYSGVEERPRASVFCPVLERLECTEGHLREMIPTLRSLNAPNLRVLDCLTRQELHDFHIIFEIIQETFEGSLRVLKYTNPVFYLKQDTPLMPLIRPLTRMSQLTTVHLDLFCEKYALSEDEVHVLAKAWPQLEELYLCNRTRLSQWNGTGFSLTSLQIFALHCARLQVLHLPIRCDTIQVSALVRPPKPSHTLRVLSLVVPTPRSHQAMDEVRSAARYVSRVFPSLDVPQSLQYKHCHCDYQKGVGRSVVQETRAFISNRT